MISLYLLFFGGLLLHIIMGMEVALWIFSIQSAVASDAIDIICLIMVLCLVLWTYFSVATPTATSLWLRRFNKQSDGFALAKAFDHLSISGMRVVTLADSKVSASRLSGGQCYIKLFVDCFVFLVTPIVTTLFIIVAWANTVLFNPEIHKPHPFVDSEDFWILLGFTTFVYALYGLWRFFTNLRRTFVLGTGVLAVDALGAKKFIAAENRRVRSGSGVAFLAGKAVLRIADAHWEAAVVSAIEGVDFIIFDATQFATNLFWELENVVASGCAHKLIIICGNEGVDTQFQRYFEAHNVSWRERLVPYKNFTPSLIDRWRYCAMIECKSHDIAVR